MEDREIKKTMKFDLRKFSVFLLVAVVVMQSTGLMFSALAAPSSTFTISGGVYPGAPSYTIWAEGSNYYAKDGNGLLASESSNASTVINNALSFGKQVLIKAATYSISAMLLVQANSFFEAEKGVVLSVVAPADAGIKIVGDNSTVKGFTIYAIGRNFGIYSVANYTTIEDNIIYKVGTKAFNGFGIAVGEYNGVNYMRGNLVKGNRVFDTGLDGIHVRYCYNTTVTDNYVEDSGDDGIASILGGSNTISDNHIYKKNAGTQDTRGIYIGSEIGDIIDSNDVREIQGNGIVLDVNPIGPYGGPCDANIISNNYVYKTGIDQSGAGFLGNGIYVNYGNFNVVSANVINLAGWAGIHIYNGTENVITGNVILNAGQNSTSWQAAILMEYYARRNKVIGNSVFSNDGDMEYGIAEVDVDCDYNQFLGNSVAGAATANYSIQGTHSKNNMSYSGTTWIP